jgi:hypothetical protein
MNDQLRLWLAPLVTRAKEAGYDLDGLIERVNDREGEPASWLEIGQLLIKELGLEDSYPSAP